MEAHRELALAYEKLGKKPEAVQTWTKVSDLAARSPQNSQMGREAAEALARLK
jgi:hypothetical protein